MSAARRRATPPGSSTRPSGGAARRGASPCGSGAAPLDAAVTEGPALQRRTSLRFAILGLLTRRPATGYDIKRDFDLTIGYAWNAHDSQIYPELRRLEEEGLIRPAATQPDGRRRRTYRVTAEGRKQRTAWLAAPAEPGLPPDELLLRPF